VPFERAWNFVNNLEWAGYRRFLARCLVYFQSSTPYPLPAEAQDWLLSPPEEDLRGFERDSSNLCAYLAGRRLASYNPGRFQVEVNPINPEEASRLPLFDLNWKPSLGKRPPLKVISLILRDIGQLANGTLREDLEALQFLSNIYQLPGGAAEILSGSIEPGQVGIFSLQRQFDRSVYAQIGVGCWPEPLAATALAAADGSKAVQKILAWLHLARLHYGYAWRVLVDWRYFDEVKEHPKFQAFLRQEDEVVAEIEGAIDRGDFPL
jgi:hypothetical protein